MGVKAQVYRGGPTVLTRARHDTVVDTLGPGTNDHYRTFSGSRRSLCVPTYFVWRSVTESLLPERFTFRETFVCAVEEWKRPTRGRGGPEWFRAGSEDGFEVRSLSVEAGCLSQSI